MEPRKGDSLEVFGHSPMSRPRGLPLKKLSQRVTFLKIWLRTERELKNLPPFPLECFNSFKTKPREKSNGSHIAILSTMVLIFSDVPSNQTNKQAWKIYNKSVCNMNCNIVCAY